jgi:hypothetical protein
LIATVLDDGEEPKFRRRLSSNLEEDEELEIPNPPLKAFKLSVASDLPFEGCVFIVVCPDQPPWAS